MKKVLNFVGSKYSVLEFIYNTIVRTIDKKLEDYIFFDIMTGTTVVAQRMFECKRIIANDHELFAYILANNYLATSKDIIDAGYELVNQLNNLKPVRGFITNNYSPIGGKLYFTEHNAMAIDAACAFARQHENHIAYYYLVSSIIESADSVANVACNYEAYLKQFKSVAKRNIAFKQPKPIHNITNSKVYCAEALDIISYVTADIIYIDPPYNRRHYSSMYHLLNTICRYASNKYNYNNYDARKDYFKSQLCYKNTAIKYLDTLIKRAKDSEYIFMSYNDEGIISHNEIKKIFSANDRLYKRYTYIKKRFNSHKESNFDNVAEYLHVSIKNK